MVAIGHSTRRALTTVALGSLVLLSMACGSDSSSAELDSGGSDVWTDVDGSTLDAMGTLDSLAPPTDVSDPTYCARTSDECYIFPEDCCNLDCATTALRPVSGGGGRGDYFRSCIERGCTPCRISAEWVPRCVDHHCTIVDLGSSAFSACMVNEDCELRWGSRCCELCHPDPVTDLVSAARTAAFCEPDDGCDPCGLAPYPLGTSAICVDGRCKVQRQ